MLDYSALQLSGANVQQRVPRIGSKHILITLFFKNGLFILAKSAVIDLPLIKHVYKPT